MIETINFYNKKEIKKSEHNDMETRVLSESEINDAFKKATVELEVNQIEAGQLFPELGATRIEAIDELTETKEEQEKNKVQDFNETQKLGVILEAIFYRAVKDFGWLGQDTHIIKSSKFDDKYNYCDFIIAKKINSKWVFISIDLSVAGFPIIQKKMHLNSKDMHSGKLPKVMLVHIETPGVKNAKGEKVHLVNVPMPKVIISMPTGIVKKLTRIWLYDEKLLKDDHASSYALDQIRIQLEAIAKFLIKRSNTNDPETIRDFINVLPAANLSDDKDTNKSTRNIGKLIKRYYR